MKIKNRIITLVIPLTIGFTVLPHQNARAVPIAVIIKVIKEAIKKVIQAIDLKVQRLQNRTIWLQNAQKVLENKLSELKLREISDWSEKQRQQYDALFQELWKVKSLISRFQRVRDIADMQAQLVTEYRKAWEVIQNSPLLLAEEKQMISNTYQHILEASLENLDHLTGIMTSFTVQMNDADRLRALHQAEKRIRGNLHDLRAFNARNYRLISSRHSPFSDPLKQHYDLDH
ncbi:putative ubiquitin-like protein YukD [Algoriphagus iocasae]|uniref:Putative ubiquitin-like protein YukD n=1 Tax=Algoriphagus iocasae TaxID=1836499 RepID=A0A841MPC7_9BACT|nr:conjugal transfer protein TraI [Algoriphagus iocasae]MBB6324488.1 putative ubiquitin-like protein YukD [Algoriphagus iocasae]